MVYLPITLYQKPTSAIGFTAWTSPGQKQVFHLVNAVHIIHLTQLRNGLIYGMSVLAHLEESFPGLWPDGVLSL